MEACSSKTPYVFAADREKDQIYVSSIFSNTKVYDIMTRRVVTHSVHSGCRSHQAKNSPTCCDV